VNGRTFAFAVAAVAIALVLAQVLAPATTFYHSWQYALALAIALAAMIAYANDALRGRDGVRGRRALVAIAGAAVVAVAGLASGLLGPDTARIAGTPATVVPIPALGAAAFFASVDASGIARGTASVTLRRRGAPPITIDPGRRRLTGESLLYLEPRPAAYVEEFDAGGERLTVTQPANASFLSPVIVFPQRQRIGALDVPLDTFAAPARHRVVRALYFTPQQLAQMGHAAMRADAPALVLAMATDDGRSLGIALAESGRVVSLGGIRVRATIGSYPALAVASAPPLWALVAGIAAFGGGIAWSAVRAR